MSGVGAMIFDPEKYSFGFDSSQDEDYSYKEDLKKNYKNVRALDFGI